MKDEYGRIQTYAQALRQMNTDDMAQFISDIIKEVSDVRLSYETVREKLEEPTE